MKPAPFDYEAPETIEQAVGLLANAGEEEIKVIAGGQSLMPLLNMRLARPRRLIDISRVTELQYIREIDGALAIGAATTKRVVEESPLVQSAQPLLHAATVSIGHPQIRNRGTVGGSMAQADPAAEYPAVALVMEAEFVARGAGGERCISAEDFFVTYLTTSLDPSELLVEVRVPTLSPATGWAFQELARRHGDFAMAGAVVTLKLDGGRCSDTRIALFGVAHRAFRAREAEVLMDGEAAGEDLFTRAAAAAADSIEDPLSDTHASAEFRRELARSLSRRALAEAAERAGGV